MFVVGLNFGFLPSTKKRHLPTSFPEFRFEPKQAKNDGMASQSSSGRSPMAEFTIAESFVTG
jgi:hypothetical protein